ncbi:MAG TPA: tetratricopeptide repeat protein [Candidatus Eisenbacteria bacterium]|jgi:tetratricopeptide (TPR) repeat protein|nr:tetratricopeptide repeat protein [Candidatus Eisenbacteria bacterium]
MAVSESLPEFDSLWDYDHPESTEAAFRKLLPAARASGNAEYLAQLLTQVARTEGLQMKFDEAWRTLDEAESMLTNETRVARIRVALERGRVLRSSKRVEESKPWFREAFDRAQAWGHDAYAVDAAHMLGIAEAGDASLQWNRRAIEIAERSADPKARRWLGSLYNNVGWSHHAAGEFDSALDLFQRALAERQAEGTEPAIHVARWCVARALRSLHRLDEALGIQRELLARVESRGDVDGFVHEEIAECLLLQGQEDDAIPHFAAAHRALSQDRWLARDEPTRLDRLRRLGGLDTSGNG